MAVQWFKMAVVVAIKLGLLFYTILSVKKASLTNSNSCCYSLYDDIPQDIKNTHCTASWWIYKHEKGLNLQPKSTVRILLILAGDVELLLGPATYNCVKCLKTIRKNRVTASCVNCKAKLHTKCLIDRLDRDREAVLSFVRHKYWPKYYKYWWNKLQWYTRLRRS